MAKALSPNSTLQNGKYTIVKVLGQGSFGITYLATTRIKVDGQLGRIEVNINVTIKEFFMEDLNSRSINGKNVERTDSSLVKNYMHKFQREAENLAKLDHPNIVKVLEVFNENNTVYYVMEFIDGSTIDDYIKEKGRLTEKEAFAILKDVGSALNYMHNNKMLHLDLKPKNIMRNMSGQVYLIDFGLSKQYNDNGEPESSTTLGLGTPGYAPLEQSTYKQDGTFPATLDIYALGGCLFKMLTGQTPPEAPLLLNEGLPLDMLNKYGICEEAVIFLQRSLSPLKKDRFQSINDMFPFMAKKISIEQEEKTAYEIPDEKESQPVVVSVDKPSVSSPIIMQILNNMVRVEGGTFLMGASDAPKTWFSKTFSGNDYDRELPVHEVSISDFYIGKYVVKIDEWEYVMGNIPEESLKYYKETELGNRKNDFPIHHITWDEGIKFIKRLSSMSKIEFRLPTEAEWEYAARGGKLSKGLLYSGSENVKEVAWVEGYNYECAVHEVGIKKPNELGVYDMSGNIREWCNDWFDDMYYKQSKWENPSGPITGEKRVCRGGCTLDSFFELRVSSRLGCDPNYRGMIGIRLACSKLRL